MPQSRQIDTEFMILRKTPYSDTSLVVAGISPDCGQIHFLVRGARRVGKRQFPLVDLFRVLHVKFRETDRELHTWRSADLAMDFAMLARDLEALQAAGWLSRFALANLLPGMKHPRFFKAMTTALQRLAASSTDADARSNLRHAAIVGTCLVYLDEGGLLPDQGGNARTERQCQDLLRMAIGETPTLRLDAGTWEKLYTWIVALLHYAECSVPELPNNSPADTTV